MWKMKIAVPMIAALLFISSAAPAHAALTESQIQSILDLLSSFGAEQSIVDNVNASLRGQTPTSSGSPSSITSTSNGCEYAGQFSRTLSEGSSGSDVSALQRFLQAQGFFTYPTITTYFGPATESAVQRWQVQHDIVSSGTPETTGYGVVGSLTRAAIGRVCETSSTNSTIERTPTTYNHDVNSSQTQNYKPTITMVRGKASDDFEAYVGEDLSIEGAYLAGNYISSTNVYVGGVKATVKEASDNLLWIVTPDLASGTYDLTVSNEKGTSNSVKVTVVAREKEDTSGSPALNIHLKGEPSYVIGQTLSAFVNYRNAPANSKIRMLLERRSDNHFFVFPPLNSYVLVVGSGTAEISGDIISQTSYLITPGNYTLHATLEGDLPDTGKEAPTLATTETIITLTDPPIVPAPTCTLTASSPTPSDYNTTGYDYSVKPNSSLTLTLTSKNATYSIFNGGKHDANFSWTEENLTETSNIYSITVYGEGGSATCSVSVYVDYKG